MISLRLTAELESKLNKVSKNENVSKSEIIKRALVLFFAEYRKKHDPFELGKDLFGKFGSGKGTLSRDYKKIFYGKLREKHSR